VATGGFMEPQFNAIALPPISEQAPRADESAQRCAMILGLQLNKCCLNASARGAPHQ
jgi:hypothetical protein